MWLAGLRIPAFLRTSSKRGTPSSWACDKQTEDWSGKQLTYIWRSWTDGIGLSTAMSQGTVGEGIDPLDSEAEISSL